MTKASMPRKAKGIRRTPVRSDAEARALFEAHIDLAERIACGFRRSTGFNVELNELRSFALIGLFDAARRFEGESEGDPFEPYARVRIRGSIQDGLRGLEWFQRRRARGKPELLEELVRLIRRAGSEIYETRDHLPLADERLDTLRTHVLLIEALNQLPERERRILDRHYFEGVTFDQIARDEGVSQPRISQLKRRALFKLREILHGHEAFLGRG